MASTLIRGKYIVSKITGPESAVVISDGAVFQRDGQIIEVGGYTDLRSRYGDAEVIGSPSYVVIPGLVNDHFHVGLSPFQLGVADLPLELWLPARIGTKDIDPYLNHLYGAMQMIRSGTTTVQVLVGSRTPANLEVANKIIKAYQDAGMRVAFASGVCNQNNLVAGAAGNELDFVAGLPAGLAKRFKTSMMQAYLSVEEHISNVEQLCEEYGSKHYGRVRVTISPGNPNRCSDDLLMALKLLATKYNTCIHTHLQETIYQKLYGLRVWGKTPLQHLHDLGFLGENVICAHSVWLTDKDIDVMAETETSICHLPSSNLRLQSGIAPINQLVQRGIRITLGTDEAGINDDKDMLQEMRLALKLHRVPGLENTSLSALQVLQIATVNGAFATGFGDLIGTLEPGKRADVVLINLKNIEEPYLDPNISVVDAIIHRAKDIDIDTVLIDGEIVMRDRQLTRMDTENLFKEMKKSLNRPLTTQEIERGDLAKQLEPYIRKFHAAAIDDLLQPHYRYNSKS